MYLYMYICVLHSMYIGCVVFSYAKHCSLRFSVKHITEVQLETPFLEDERIHFSDTCFVEGINQAIWYVD